MTVPAFFRKTFRIRHQLIVCMVLFFLPLSTPVSSEPLPALSGQVLYGTTKHYSLKPGEENQAWEYRFELPEQNGQISFWTRSFKTEGLLIVDQEALSQNTYYVKVRLLGKKKETRSGSFHVWMKRNTKPSSEQQPPVPEIRFNDTPLEPEFVWVDPMETLAFSLYDRESGELLHQEVYTGCEYFECFGLKLKIGGKYLIIATQSDKWGRYSSPTNLAFRIGIVEETCPECHGEGVDWDYPNPNSSTPPVCIFCKGTGIWNKDAFIPEKLSDE